MTTGHVFIATSLDGFVARPDHSLDWLMKQDTEGEDHGFEAFMASVDGIIMGSGSFRNVLSFGQWPYKKPVIVMSQSMTHEHIPGDLRDRVEISTLSPAALMADLGGRGWGRVYVDGGQIVQSFLRARLISDIVLTLVPILIGDGIKLFGALDQDMNFTLKAIKAYPSGLLRTEYQIK